jgi:hypothetical protein
MVKESNHGELKKNFILYQTLGMIAWVRISTTLQSTLTPTARYAAFTNPWIETVQDNVPHCLIRRNVSDTGRIGQKWWEIDFVI